MIADELEALNIVVEKEYAGWDILVPEQLVNTTHDNGGFDLMTMFYETAGEFNPYLWYHTDNAPFSAASVNDVVNCDDIIDRINSEFDREKRKLILQEWQDWYYETLPDIPIFTSQQLHSVRPEIVNFEDYMWKPRQTYKWMWYLEVSGVDEASLVYASTETPTVFHPFFARCGSREMWWAPVFDTLATRDTNMDIIPNMASDWDNIDGPNGPQTRWVINLRDDMTWHDGVKVNATDVWYTWKMLMTDELGLSGTAYIQEIFGSIDNVEITGEYQLTVDLPKPWLYFEADVMVRTAEIAGVCIIPWHVLKDVPLDEWQEHAFNTGQFYVVNLPDGTTYNANGPIGCGPYKFMGFDSSTNTATYELFEDYWDNERPPGANVKTWKVQQIAEITGALAGLKAGTVHILHEYYNPSKKVDEIEEWGGIVYKQDMPRWHIIQLECNHPIFGTGVDTPLGKEDPTRAAEAARYVRRAFAHVIPRQRIIDQLIVFGKPIATPVTETMWSYEYHEPFEYNIETAKQYMEMAGYTYAVEDGEEPPPSLWDQSGTLIAIVAIVIVVAAVGVYALRRRPT
jgi:ABC-type transport system substrate-binding protein